VPYPEFHFGGINLTEKKTSLCRYSIITIIKTTDELRNVGDAAVGRDAYAMSHLPAEAAHSGWLQGVVTGISLQQQQLARSNVHTELPSTERQV